MKNTMIFLLLIATIFVSCENSEEQDIKEIRQRDGVVEYASRVSTAVEFADKDLSFLQLEDNKVMYASFKRSVEMELELKNSLDSLILCLPETGFEPVKLSMLKHSITVDISIEKHKNALNKFKYILEQQ